MGGVGFTFGQALTLLFARDLAAVRADADVVAISSRGGAQREEELASGFPVTRIAVDAPS